MKTRAAYSFFAAFVGWLATFTGLLAFMQFGDHGHGAIDEFDFYLRAPLMFTTVGWLVLGLPIAVKTNAENAANPWFVIPVATVTSTLAFVVLLGRLSFDFMFLIWWPIVSGAIGGSVFWVLEQFRPRHTWLLWAIPLAFFPLIQFVVLPAGIAVIPYPMYVITDGAIGNRALYATLARVRPGDSYADLHASYPRIFQEPTTSMIAEWGDGSGYAITFDSRGGRVSSIVIRPSSGR